MGKKKKKRCEMRYGQKGSKSKSWRAWGVVASCLLSVRAGQLRKRGTHALPEQQQQHRTSLRAKQKMKRRIRTPGRAEDDEGETNDNGAKNERMRHPRLGGKRKRGPERE